MTKRPNIAQIRAVAAELRHRFGEASAAEYLERYPSTVRASIEQARLADLIAADPFAHVPLARYTATAKRPRRISEAELRAMGLEVAREFRRLYSQDH